ncbi:MAG TPA: hypothetical protein VKQ70_10485 [Caulobacteraceae bacterium]|jgi:hypothetical protein|nr:hypothetical protein [Caulobacteraceae bacterium]
MCKHVKSVLAGLAAVGALAVAAPSFAGCADSAAAHPADWSGQASDLRQKIDFGGPSFGGGSIVGLWSVSLVSGGNQVDWGYAEWHADGTEIMNSGGHTPASGNFCLGVWRQTGPNSFHLKHFPLAYNPATGALAAKIILTEDVSIDRNGQTFVGSFSEDIYDPTGVTLEQHIPGTITGHRVQPN